LATTGTFVACGGDDTTPNNPVDAGKDTNLPDNNVPPVDSQPPVDTGVDAGPSLYQRLGGHDGLKKIITDTVTLLLADPQQASYFVFNAPAAANHPTAVQIIDCFTLLGDSAIPGGPGTPYPAKLTDGYQCRDMVETHKGQQIDGGTRPGDTNFHIPNGVFNDFVAAAAKAATTDLTASGDPKVAADVQALGGLLGALKPAIVDTAAADGGYFEGGPADAADDG
jgi:hypothetical protein